MLTFSEAPFVLDSWEDQTQSLAGALAYLAGHGGIMDTNLEEWLDLIQPRTVTRLTPEVREKIYRVLASGYKDPETEIARRQIHQQTGTIEGYLIREILDLAAYHYLECQPWGGKD
jgi:hypothetical protein